MQFSGIIFAHFTEVFRFVVKETHPMVKAHIPVDIKICQWSKYLRISICCNSDSGLQKNTCLKQRWDHQQSPSNTRVNTEVWIYCTEEKYKRIIECKYKVVCVQDDLLLLAMSLYIGIFLGPYFSELYRLPSIKSFLEICPLNLPQLGFHWFPYSFIGDISLRINCPPQFVCIYLWLNTSNK